MTEKFEQVVSDSSVSTPTGAAAGFVPRLDSVDMVRGLAMVLMALDHVRHFFSDALAVHATDLAKTTAPLFLTRWITHFCAPWFVFLAGTGIFLAGAGPRGKSRRQLSIYLVTRGVWLILLELTFVRCLGWSFNFDYHHVLLGVIWALGWSMVAMAALIHLPRTALLVLALAMIAGHNALDGVKPSAFGGFAWLWKVLDTSRYLEPTATVHLKVGYPLLP